MNQRELDVLNILYQVGEPMMATDIVNRGGELTQSTVTAVLRVLLQRGLVEVTGVTHSGKVLSRTYQPTPAAKEALLKHFTGLYESFRSVVTPEELLKSIKELHRSGVDEKEVAEETSYPPVAANKTVMAAGIRRSEIGNKNIYAC